MAVQNKVSLPVIKRLPKYYRYLTNLSADGKDKISSSELAHMMGTTASQVRQDFNCFGGFGQQGIGSLLGYRLQLLRVRGEEVERGADFALYRLWRQVAAGRAFEQATHAIVDQPFRSIAALHSQSNGFLRHHLKGFAAAHVAELVAQTQKVKGGDNLHVIGKSGSATGGQRTFATECVFQQVLSQQANQRVTAMQFAEVDELGFVDAVVGQALAQGFGEVLRQEACSLLATDFQW